VNDVDFLVKQIELAFGQAAANDLRGLLAAAQAAQNEDVWNEAIRNVRSRFRTLMKQQLRRYIPPPILALPGVEAFILALLDRALAEGGEALAGAAKEIALGPAEAALNMAAVYLPLPPNLQGPNEAAGLRPALIGFLPPTGLALNFMSGPAGGGGALDYLPKPNPRLSGSFGLKMGVVQVAALSILEEKAGAYSMMTLLKGRFTPGIQLGFGFAISGMGGLIGVNRAVNGDALEAHFRSGALINALFGDDPIRNAASTLDTLGAVFQMHMGAHVIGPSMQLSWLKVGTFTLFNVDLGIYMQLPSPLYIGLIGSVRAGIPPIFQLRLDVRGDIDAGRRMINFHAVIVDSYMMGVFKMQGEALFRMRYGDDSFVVLTIGGFFPGFNPAPAELPPDIQRVGMSLDLPVDLPIYLRVAGYLAVTPNSLQFGAHMEAGFDGGIFSAEGHFLLDAIFQFDPFEFAINFSAGFHIKVLGKSFSGVTCTGTISGPGPLVIHAHISYKTPIFLPNINWSDTFTIGRPSPRVAGTADLFEAMQKELNPGNLRAENGSDPHVALNVKGSQDGKYALLAPLGDLLWAQSLAPLDLELERLQNTPLPAPNCVSVTAPGEERDKPREQFNLGMYRNLSDAERMDLNARLESHPSGVRYHFPLQSGAEETREIKFQEFRQPELVKLPSEFYMLLSAALLYKVSDRSQPARVVNLEPRVAIRRESWRCNDDVFDTQAAAFIASKKSGAPAYLDIENGAVNMEGV
jgi:hypothetical protein